MWKWWHSLLVIHSIGDGKMTWFKGRPHPSALSRLGSWAGKGRIGTAPNSSEERSLPFPEKEGRFSQVLWPHLLFLQYILARASQSHCYNPVTPPCILLLPISSSGALVAEDMVIPRTCECHLMWQKGLCRRDQVKDLKMGRSV